MAIWNNTIQSLHFKAIVFDLALKEKKQSNCYSTQYYTVHHLPVRQPAIDWLCAQLFWNKRGDQKAEKCEVQ